MNVLIAKINGSQGLTQTQCALLDIKMQKKGSSSVRHLFNPQSLLDAMNAGKERKVVLFTNFPPDSSYPDSGKSIQTKEKDGVTHRFWEADGYRRSERYFKYLAGFSNLVSVHFISGAPIDKVSD